jgi:GT2 family glycosyltransferase
VEALIALDYPKDRYEIIVVDDGGDHPVTDLPAPGPGGPALRTFRQKNCGPAAARNRGAQEARGRFLAFTDDDCRPSAQWLAKFGPRLEAAPDAAVGGTTVNALGENLFSEASETLLQALYAFSNRDPERGRFIASNNLAMSRDVFHANNGFDAGFPLAAAEDRDFCDRWTYSGRRIVWEPTAIVLHYHAHTLRSFLRQHFNYGRGAVLYQQLRRDRGSGGLKDDVGFHVHFFRWLRGPLARHSFPRKVVLTGAVLLTQAAYVCGYLAERAGIVKR